MAGDGTLAHLLFERDGQTTKVRARARFAKVTAPKYTLLYTLLDTKSQYKYAVSVKKILLFEEKIPKYTVIVRE